MAAHLTNFVSCTSVMKTLNPEFADAEAAFDVTSTAASIDVALWDFDKFSSPDPMGHIVLPLAELPDGKEIEETYRYFCGFKSVSVA